MKHNIKIVFMLVGMFLIAQLLGLMIINSYDSFYGKTAAEEGIERAEVSVVGETVPPELEIKTAFDVTQILFSIIFAIAIATLLFLFLSKIKIVILFKAWFTIVVFVCLTIAFSLLFYPVIGMNFISVFGKTFSLAEFIAIPLAALFTFYKIFKRNIIAHNFSELFIYPGLAVIFLPLLNVLVAALLLVAIAVYDVWAVWKSKHMLKLAKFQIQHLKIFTGFFLPYIPKKDRIKIQKLRIAMKRKEEMEKKRRKKGKKGRKGRKQKEIKIRAQIAALGGGDVAFPLIFAGTIMLAFNMLAALLVVFCSTLSLLFLFYISKKGKAYPAMLFLTPGCLVGLLLVLLIF